MLPTDEPHNASPDAIYSNSFLREILLSLRLVAGPAYPRLLHAAGMDAYSAALPEPTTELTATPADVARLFSVGYTHLPPAQAMLFFTNLGEHTARQTWADPAVQAIAEIIKTTPISEQVVVAWRELIAIVNVQARVGREVYSDASNDYLALSDCPYCQDIHGAKQPACFATARFYEVLLKNLLGRPVIVREVECRAMGAARCIYAVRRPRVPGPFG